MSQTRPVLGAAMTVPDLAAYLPWLRERDRDLELQDFCEPAMLDRDWSDLVAEAKRQLVGWKGRLGIHGPFYGFTLDCPDPAIRAVIHRRLDRFLDLCAALGADQMVVHSPVTTWDDHNRLDWPDTGARQLAAVEACLRPALTRAESLGITLVLENIEDRDPSTRVSLCSALDSPALAVSLDTGHAHYAHVATGAPPVDYYVAAAGNRLQHVHVQDADGWADRHWAPGDGTIRWAAVFAALARLDTPPRLLLEMRAPHLIARGAAWLAAQELVD
jgi:sugar phosphate isomerase/epimerase